MKIYGINIIVFGFLLLFSSAQVKTREVNHKHQENFNRGNIHAWAFIFADPIERTPQERAKVLADLGFKRAGFGALEQHVMRFEEYVLAYRQHGIEIIGVYRSINIEAALEDPGTKYLFDVIERQGIRPQLWLMLNDSLISDLSEDLKVDKAIKILKPVILKARSLGCKVALYNHTSWFGEPENQLKMVRLLRNDLNDNEIGIVYNFHHGHAHNDKFEQFFPEIEPYLFALHLNGMKVGGNKIMTIGSGNREKKMLEVVYETAYDGPVGILDHVGDRLPEEVYPENFAGLKKLLAEVGDSIAAASY